MKATSALIALGAALVASAQDFPNGEYANPLLAKVLLYTYTDGFRHDSIPTAIQELQKWGPYWNISFDATEDPGKFTPANLAQYDAVMCVHTTGRIFDAAAQNGFVDYLSKGGNFVGIHAASAGYLDKVWAPYTDSIGATFDHHPKFQPATFVKEMHDHPATDACPDRWTFGEEVYSFTTDPRKTNGAKLLWSVDPSSYKENSIVAAQGTPHPIAWVQDYNAGAVTGANGVPGRSFYSSLGHANGTWHDATFMKHVMGGLSWVFGSNTTRVATGLYGGAAPTVHTGSTNNATTGAAATWNAVLGSSQTAPPPPPPLTTPTSSSSGPEATGGSSTSGAVSVRSGMAWALVAALAGFVSL
ncbi:hypothetical protein RhiJN_21399 [Ceratobasidium sp. AG-Ba]|nr:hypothetical protein RhiJN_21399 [Ceratobasidium sp. AG-Ba]